ncbi:MAG: NADH-quinone oxidoreductase subunit C [Desulfonatronovibrio sp.]
MNNASSHPQLIQDCSACADQKARGCAADIFLRPDDISRAAVNLSKAGYFIEDISCVDTREGFLLVYHFDRFQAHHRVSLRILISKTSPEIPSISETYPGADWHERECFDFFGVKFTNHPNLIPLLLDPEHDGPPPLIKKEKDLKDMHELYPGWTTETISPDSPRFSEAINHTPTPGQQEQL